MSKILSTFRTFLVLTLFLVSLPILASAQGPGNICNADDCSWFECTNCHIKFPAKPCPTSSTGCISCGDECPPMEARLDPGLARDMQAFNSRLLQWLEERKTLKPEKILTELGKQFQKTMKARATFDFSSILHRYESTPVPYGHERFIRPSLLKARNCLLPVGIFSLSAAMERAGR